jgi:transcriptional regulator with PAS, ATPase and Fis domain
MHRVTENPNPEIWPSAQQSSSFHHQSLRTPYGSQASLYYLYLIDSINEVLDLDVIKVGDLFLTDDKGKIIYVRSNKFLPTSILSPGVTIKQKFSFMQAISDCLKSRSVSTVLFEEENGPSSQTLLSLAIPVADNDKLTACVGFITNHNNDPINLNMIQGVIQTAVQAGTRMVSARKTIDDLHMLHEFYENLDNSIGVMLLDYQLHILQINRETEIIMGLVKDDMVGKPLELFLVSPVELPSIEEKQTYIELKTTSGNLKTMAHFSPMHNSHGLHLGWRLTISPITAEKSSLTSTPSLFQFDDIIGSNTQFLRLIKLARSISRSPSSVLIIGETGTGKELFAQAIHCASTYAKGPFVAINCAAIPSELIETELFGYAQGAFTGAKKTGYKGKILQANGGTLFLDEIGDMPLELQSKLLRVLQERVVTPVGGNKPIPIDVRIISATNQDLEKMIKERTFRADLYYRLNVINIKLPPLRNRKDDIPILTKYFLNKYALRLGKVGCVFADTALQALEHYNWPGNVRELENVVEMAVNLAQKEVKTEHLPKHIVNYSPEKTFEDEGLLTLEELEKRQIIRVLNTFEGNITQAATALNIGRTTLYRKIKKYNLVRFINIGEGGAN